MLVYLYRTTLSRDPTPGEVKYIIGNFNDRRGTRWLPRDRSNQNTHAAYEQYYQDIMWALLNCNEFILNH